jgi:hypothetical protein
MGGWQGRKALCAWERWQQKCAASGVLHLCVWDQHVRSARTSHSFVDFPPHHTASGPDLALRPPPSWVMLLRAGPIQPTCIYRGSTPGSSVCAKPVNGSSACRKPRAVAMAAGARASGAAVQRLQRCSASGGAAGRKRRASSPLHGAEWPMCGHTTHVLPPHIHTRSQDGGQPRGAEVLAERGGRLLRRRQHVVSTGIASDQARSPPAPRRMENDTSKAAPC